VAAAQGAIVGGLFSTHVPRLMILDPDARRAYMGKNVTTFYDALPKLYAERLAELDFDTFVVIDTHWHSTLEFILNAHARHEGIYTSDEIPWMIHEYAYDYPGDPELAALIADEAKARGVPAEAAAHRGLPVHYGTLNPMHYYNPGPAKKRVLPVSVLDTAEVEPNLRFGEAVFWPLATIRQRASADPSDVSDPALRAFDERIMASWRAGDHATVLAQAEEFRRTCSPEGRFAHYLVLAGAHGGAAWTARGEQFGRYEAAIGTGQSIFWFAS
jgi:3,4-dihydroxyphenylacetate 2,3-dioxygenase